MEDNKIFYNSDGYKLCGILNEVNKDKKIVVICHANFSNKGSNPVRKLQERLKVESINSFAFDFRCCGESTGFDNEYTIKGLTSDLENTLCYLEKAGYDKFILVGMSMGGRIVSLVNTSKHKILKEILWYPAIPTDDLKTRIKKMFTKSASEREAIKNGFTTIHNKNFKLSPAYFKEDRTLYSSKFFANDIPKLILHGNNDTYVKLENSEKLAKLCNNATLKVIDQGTHSFSNSPESLDEAIDLTISFIKKHENI